MAAQRVQGGRHHRSQRLALAGLHLDDAAAREGQRGHDLHVERPQAEGAAGRLARERKELRLELVERRAGSGVRPKLARPQRERRVGQARDLRLQPGDGVERRVEPAQIEIDWRASEAREALAPPDAVADGRAGASRCGHGDLLIGRITTGSCSPLPGRASRACRREVDRTCNPDAPAAESSGVVVHPTSLTDLVQQRRHRLGDDLAEGKSADRPYRADNQPGLSAVILAVEFTARGASTHAVPAERSRLARHSVATSRRRRAPCKVQGDDQGQGRRVRLAGAGAGREGLDAARGRYGRPDKWSSASS